MFTQTMARVNSEPHLVRSFLYTSLLLISRSCIIGTTVRDDSQKASTPATELQTNTLSLINEKASSQEHLWNIEDILHLQDSTTTVEEYTSALLSVNNITPRTAFQTTSKSKSSIHMKSKSSVIQSAWLITENTTAINANATYTENTTETSQGKTIHPSFREIIHKDNEKRFTLVSSSCQTDHADRICSCDSTCALLNNCCFDSDYVDSEGDTSSGIATAAPCFTNLNSKWWLKSSRFLVANCPPTWPDDDIKKKCLTPSSENPNENIPCYSSSVRINYKNVYCLQCNGQRSSIPWVAEFDCKTPRLYDDVNSLASMLSLAQMSTGTRGCNFLVSPPVNTSSPHCVRVDVDRCQGNNTNDFLKRACLAYVNPVFSRYSRTVYKNIHCLRCYIHDDGVSVKSKFVRKDASPATMSILLDINPVIIQRPQTTSIHQSDQQLSDDQSVFKGMRGYAKLFNFTVTINSTDKTHANPHVPLASIMAFQVSLIGHLKRRLNDFPNARVTTLNVRNYPVSSKLLTGIFRVFVAGYINMEKIKYVREISENMEFTFVYESRILMFCCSRERPQSYPQSDPVSVSSAGNAFNLSSWSSANEMSAEEDNCLIDCPPTTVSVNKDPPSLGHRCFDWHLLCTFPLALLVVQNLGIL